MKKVFWIALFGAMLVGILGAQDFGFQNTAQNFSLKQFGYNAVFGLSPMQAQGQYPGYDPEAIKAQQDAAAAPMWAGLKNMAFGLWSWQNGDTFGGALTAGLEGGGIALSIVGIILMDSLMDPNDISTMGTAMIMPLGGVAVLAGGILFGYFRGSSQYKKQNAVAWTGNPLDHITATALPTVEGGVAGSLVFRAAF